jgi:hypothetical protein
MAHGVGYGSTHMFLHESLTRPVHADEPARTYRVLTHADCGLMSVFLACSVFVLASNISHCQFARANGACPCRASVRKHTALIRAVEGSRNVSSWQCAPKPVPQLYQEKIKNETPKKACGDKRQEWRLHCQIPHTETSSYVRNLAVPRGF